MFIKKHSLDTMLSCIMFNVHFVLCSCLLLSGKCPEHGGRWPSRQIHGWKTLLAWWPTHYTTLQYSTVAVLHYATLCTTLFCTTLHCITLHCTAAQDWQEKLQEMPQIHLSNIFPSRREPSTQVAVLEKTQNQHSFTPTQYLIRTHLHFICILNNNVLRGSYIICVPIIGICSLCSTIFFTMSMEHRVPKRHAY